MRHTFILTLLLIAVLYSNASILTVGKGKPIYSIKQAIHLAQPFDTILITAGTYKEGNIIIDKTLYIKGINYPVLDGERKCEILSIKSSSTVINGLTITHSGYATLDDPGAIKVYDARNVSIINNRILDNFFGIYLQFSKNCLIQNNTIIAYGTSEEKIGNGIHCWKSDSIQIIANNISGHRDGIYFEFVTASVIWRNTSTKNIRYGLHFMFSNNDSYISNVFKHNGSGVAVMFTHNVKMFNNWFIENWGDATYGLLLKEISDSYLFNNRFIGNTMGIYMEGTNRITISNGVFENNGWGMKIQASCMDNRIEYNNFIGNTFDVSTNGSLVLNTFTQNYWDKYTGYDLDKNNIGDVPYHPLSLFSVIVETNGPVMILYQSLFALLLDQSEKVMPSLTPDNFIDLEPYMHALNL
ncbi:MAG: nitrous oxide reductase family maturation protein NosD [Bacteroidota bacterium]